MKNKKKLVFAVLFFCMVLGYIFKCMHENNGKIQKIQNKNVESDIKNNDLEYMSANEFNSLADDYKTIYDYEYNNISLINMKIDLPKAESINNILIKGNRTYLDHNKTDELINKEMEFLEYFIDEEIKEEDLWDSSHGISYIEMKEQLNENKYYSNRKEMPALTYGCMDGEKPYSYAHIFGNFDIVWFDRGTLSNALDREVPFPQDEYEVIKRYELDDSLDDQYQMLNGTISIRGAIEFCEDYLNNNMPYDMSKDAVLKVRYVDVIKIRENLYCLQLGLSRNYKGIPFEMGGLIFDCKDDELYLKDRAIAYMINTDELDKYCGHNNGNSDSIESMEKISGVITVKNAFDIMSKKIGNNSFYEVSRLEVVYRIKIINGNTADNTEYVGVPCYKITAINNNDMKETYFYVEMETGVLTYDTLE